MHLLLKLCPVYVTAYVLGRRQHSANSAVPTGEAPDQVRALVSMYKALTGLGTVGPPYMQAQYLLIHFSMV